MGRVTRHQFVKLALALSGGLALAAPAGPGSAGVVAQPEPQGVLQRLRQVQQLLENADRNLHAIDAVMAEWGRTNAPPRGSLLAAIDVLRAIQQECEGIEAQAGGLLDRLDDLLDDLGTAHPSIHA